MLKFSEISCYLTYTVSCYTKTSRHLVQGIAMHAFKRVHYLQRIYTDIYMYIHIYMHISWSINIRIIIKHCKLHMKLVSLH